MAIEKIDYYGQFTPTGVDMSAAKRFQALAGLADRANELAFNVAAKGRKKQGVEAGIQAGIEAAAEGKPIESKKGFLSGISIFDQAYNEAMESAYLAGIDNDAREEISRIAAENESDVAAFNQISTEYINGLMGGVSEEFKPLVQMSIDSVVTGARMQVQQREIAKNVKAADDALVSQINRSTQDAMKFAQIGDQEASQTSRLAAFNAIDVRVRSGQINETAGEELKKGIMVAVNGETARGGMQQIIRTQGPMGAVEFIQRLDDAGPIEGFDIEQKDALVNTLRSDLSQYIQLENIKDAEMESNLKQTQLDTTNNLYIGISNGTVDLGQVQLAAINGSISQAQLEKLTNVMNNRGQGVDDYVLIRSIQNMMTTDPEGAQSLIIENTGTRLSGKTSNELFGQASSAMTAESPLQMPKAKRFKSYLTKNVAVVGPLGQMDYEEQQRLADLTLVYDQRVLAGEDPAEVARDLVDVNDILTDPIDDVPARKQQLIEQRANGTITESEYKTKFNKLENYQSRLNNMKAFEADLNRALGIK